ncbi:MAG: hypothetical protein RLZZ584_2620, partial [Pseudomonadota bacterium]
ADLIGNGKHHLIPTWQPITDGGYQSARRSNSTPPGKATAQAKNTRQATALTPRPGRMLTQHTGLPPRGTGAVPAAPRKKRG